MEIEGTHVRSSDFLRAGLIGHHNELYKNSASFHQAVDSLVHMLPLWIEALAVESRRQDVNAMARQMVLRKHSIPPFGGDWNHD